MFMYDKDIFDHAHQRCPYMDDKKNKLKINVYKTDFFINYKTSSGVTLKDLKLEIRSHLVPVSNIGSIKRLLIIGQIRVVILHPTTLLQLTLVPYVHAKTLESWTIARHFLWILPLLLRPRMFENISSLSQFRFLVVS